ncbi:MAG: tRNA (adenosine(37)-N6)-threonylcarbamoyltransferase complex ATPase subunit type 1 TsaE [Aquificae bacterium]|nr:tRNA (adenosine(37)-N6)-threonylcarbamoyltransferase complex ATPase subunit type 1 TsaE [Aquificota bacterium]
MEKTFHIKSLEELESFAGRLANCLKGNELILLSGDLASGKTTFTRFLVSAISKQAGEEVNSPTFTVVNQYETENYPIFHVDLYRVNRFDLSDFLGEGLVIVEWPDESLFRLKDFPVIKISFQVAGDNERILKVSTDEKSGITDCL